MKRPLMLALAASLLAACQSAPVHVVTVDVAPSDYLPPGYTRGYTPPVLPPDAPVFTAVAISGVSEPAPTASSQIPHIFGNTTSSYTSSVGSTPAPVSSTYTPGYSAPPVSDAAPYYPSTSYYPSYSSDWISPLLSSISIGFAYGSGWGYNNYHGGGYHGGGGHWGHGGGGGWNNGGHGGGGWGGGGSHGGGGGGSHGGGGGGHGGGGGGGGGGHH